ncbi:probable Xaa-Pro aminopeptidase P [Selaginella moellendorffii]|uniref:probable Xaa-Pro aminopeptidase P n=1 Tax=Selaginella moellendorffii TaxID=88036 RepID=UPI000D1C89EB|nr:probable Xaa-Pro aminopeptidase P [Selaginella moellendorffii]|eukprot:XP_024526213.1 probable Xaa-Pro aminopeptidase P [Selaginella moellendorffii]
MVPLGSARLLRCSVLAAAAARRGIGAGIRRSSSISMAMPSPRGNLTALCSGSKNPGPGITAEPSSVRNARKNVKDKEFVPDKKLADLRKLMSESGVQAYIVPSEDAHQSEFIAECFTRRAYISGFTGSAGTAVITLEKAALWTDGRYYLQAENQLGPEWTLMRGGSVGVPSYSEWLRDNLSAGSAVGIDPFLVTHEGAEELRRTLSAKEIQLTFVDRNLIDKIWLDGRPCPPKSPLRVHDLIYAGVDVAGKLSDARKKLSAAGATGIVITMLDEVAWLFNLRGGDVPHSPVAYAYALVDMDKATLFTDLSKVTPDVEMHLENSSVTVKEYSALLSTIQRLAESGSKLWLDPTKTNMAIVNAFSEGCTSFYAKADVDGKNGISDGPAALHRPSPLSVPKAIKNAAEMSGMKQAHLRDAAALVEFWAWLEVQIVTEKAKLTEVEVGDELFRFRSKQEGFLETSFDTICGSGANGAIVHYRAESDTCALVDDEHMLLLDSGAQYTDGTTDITRTVHFGVPTDYQKECFTRVLQGHISIDQAVFPENTPGFVLDVLARSSLWRIGLDYRHGTGHGVGAALNVHEGPQSISFRFGNMTALQPGMIISNEPGYYEDHKFGIRIENLLHVCEVETPNRFGGVSYLGFECLSFVPIQTKLMALHLLSDEDISWVNKYHAAVWDKVSPLVNESAREWLKRNTLPIKRA